MVPSSKHDMVSLEQEQELLASRKTYLVSAISCDMDIARITGGEEDAQGKTGESYLENDRDVRGITER